MQKINQNLVDNLHTLTQLANKHPSREINLKHSLLAEIEKVISYNLKINANQLKDNQFNNNLSILKNQSSRIFSIPNWQHTTYRIYHS